MAFRGWPVEAIEFFEGLVADNSKAYWTEHKATYDEHVRAPMEALLDDLAPKYGEGKIFRPHRDVRFSNDKTPYKTNIAATMAEGPYVSLDADGFDLGRGYYLMAKDQLQRFREAVDDDSTGTQLEELKAKIEDKGIEVTTRDALKTAPRGWPKDHPRIELLRMKGLIAWRHWEVGAWLDGTEPKKRLVQFAADSEPLVTWLDTNVGPSELDDGWGR